MEREKKKVQEKGEKERKDGRKETKRLKTIKKKQVKIMTKNKNIR